MSKDNGELGKMSFEKALDELEQLVKKMEDGNLSLDEMLACFERGCVLSKACRGKLEKLEKKIELLLKDDGQDGEWADFDTSSTRESATMGNRKTPGASNSRRHKPVDDTMAAKDDENSDFLF